MFYFQSECLNLVYWAAQVWRLNPLYPLFTPFSFRQAWSLLEIFPFHPADGDFSQRSSEHLHLSTALLAWEAMTLKALYLIYFSIPAIEMFALIRLSKLPSTDELPGDFLLFFFPAHSQTTQNEPWILSSVWLEILNDFFFHSTIFQAVYNEFSWTSAHHVCAIYAVANLIIKTFQQLNKSQILCSFDRWLANR